MHLAPAASLFTEPSALARRYVDICTKTLSEEELKNILSEDVTLHHQNNTERPVSAKGRDQVTALFKKYIFDNTPAASIDVKETKYQPVEGGIILTLEVAEDKRENNKLNRYLFKETTFFTFQQGENIPCKISSIVTHVQRQPI